MFEKVKRYYDLGIYTAQMVAEFVRKGKLTPEEYEEITAEPWTE